MENRGNRRNSIEGPALNTEMGGRHFTDYEREVAMNWGRLVDQAELEAQEELEDVDSTMVLATGSMTIDTDAHSSVREVLLGKPMTVAEVEEDEGEEATDYLDETGLEPEPREPVVVLPPDTNLTASGLLTFNSNIFLEDFDDLIGWEDDEPFDIFPADEASSYTTQGNHPRWNQSDGDDVLTVGQLDFGKIHLLTQKVTKEEALGQTTRLEQRHARFLQQLPPENVGIRMMPSNLGPLKADGGIEAISSYVRIKTDYIPLNLSGNIVVQKNRCLEVFDFYKPYQQPRNWPINKVHWVNFYPDSSELGPWTIGLYLGDQPVLRPIRVAVDEKTNILFSTLYESMGVPTTGLGFSTHLHFYCIMMLVQHASDFSVEEHRVDLVIMGQKIEISTKLDRGYKENTIHIDKYSLTYLCGDPRMASSLWSSLMADKNQLDALTRLRRSFDKKKNIDPYLEIDDVIWDITRLANRLSQSHKKAMVEMELEAQLQTHKKSRPPDNNFERDKQICLDAIKSAIDFNYTESKLTGKWGCSTPYRALRRGEVDLDMVPVMPNWYTQIHGSIDLYDVNHKRNYWVEQGDLEQVARLANSIDGNNKYWGYEDKGRSSPDKLGDVQKLLIVCKTYAAAQITSAVSVILQRSRARRGKREYAFILQRRYMVTWISSFDHISKTEKYKVELLRGVNDFDEVNIPALRLLEGSWKRFKLFGLNLELSPMFTVSSGELQDLFSAPRRMLNLYTTMYDRMPKASELKIIEMLNPFYLATVTGTWKTTTLVGSHRYLTERIMSGYIDPSLITDKICPRGTQLKLYCEYYYLILLQQCIKDWTMRHNYVATSPLFRLPTTFLGLELNMHYMMGSAFSTGSRHDETCMEKTLKELVEYRGRYDYILAWLKRQKQFLIDMEKDVDPNVRFEQYLDLRLPPQQTNKRNCVNLLVYIACTAFVADEVKRKQPGQDSGYATFTTMVTNKAIMSVRNLSEFNSENLVFKKNRVCLELYEMMDSLWCKTLPYALMLFIELGLAIINYYFSKDQPKGDREISVMDLLMRLAQIIGESCVTRLSSDMYGDTMVDKEKRMTFYRQTRKKPGYKKPGFSAEDRERFGPNLMPALMSSQLSILASMIGDATLSSAAMCVNVFTDKMGVLPPTFDIHNVKVEKMKQVVSDFKETCPYTEEHRWQVGRESKKAITFPCKVSMGQGLFGRCAGISHNVVLTAFDRALERFLKVRCEHTVSSDDVFRSVSVPETCTELTGVSVLLFTSQSYQDILIGAGTLDSVPKKVVTENMGEYNNITVFEDPRMNPDPSIVEAICSVNSLPHSDVISDIQHARSSAKAVFVNGGTLSMVVSTMRCYNQMLSQKWLNSEDFHVYNMDSRSSIWGRLTSERVDDIMSPLISLLTPEEIVNLSTYSQGPVKEDSDVINILSNVGYMSRKRRQLPEADNHFFWDNEMHQFNRSMKGCIRGLRIETRTPTIFKIKKNQLFTIRDTGSEKIYRSTAAALEHYCTHPARGGVPKITIQEVESLVKIRAFVLSHPMVGKRPFRTFNMVKSSSLRPEINRVQMIWMEMLDSYRPPTLSGDVVSKHRALDRAKKMEMVKQLERLDEFRILVNHSCGEPRQGFLFGRTQDMGFHIELDYSRLPEVNYLYQEPLIWGGDSLLAVMSDWHKIRKSADSQAILAQRNEKNELVYNTPSKRAVRMVGMVYETIESNPEVRRYVDNQNNVIYAVPHDDYTDIEPPDFGIQNPNISLSSLFVMTPFQSFNKDNYSRTRNETTRRISNSVGIRMSDWCVEGTVRFTQTQMVHKLNPKFRIVHLDPYARETGMIRISLSEETDDIGLHLDDNMDKTNPEICGTCRVVLGIINRQKKKVRDRQITQAVAEED